MSSSTVGSYSLIVTGGPGIPPLTHRAEISITVTKANPSISSSLSATSIALGGFVSDSALLTGATGTASGAVAYNLFSGGICSGTSTVLFTVSVTNGTIPASGGHSFNSTGTFSWNAVYSGDSNNNPATSPCEALTVMGSTADFTMSASSSTLTLQQGDDGSIRVSVRSLGFVGRMNLTVTVSPNIDDAVNGMLMRKSLTIHLNGSRDTLLRVETEEDTPIGNYTIVVTGTAGSASVSVMVKITVTAHTEAEYATTHQNQQSIQSPRGSIQEGKDSLMRT
jgi:hypothetical protein